LSPEEDVDGGDENLFFLSEKSKQGNEKVATLPEDSRKHGNCLAPGQIMPCSLFPVLGPLPEEEPPGVRVRFVPALGPAEDSWSTLLLHDARRETNACRILSDSSCCLGPMVDG